MPIVRDETNPKIIITNQDGEEEEIDNVYVEYFIPEKYKKMCTKDFLEEFRNQLIRIDQYYSLDTFADEGIPINTSTCGWAVALFKACINTNKEELWNYWRTLPWYDSDIFDGELADLLIENNIILDDIDKYAIKYNITTSTDKIKYCCKCYDLYLDEDMEELPKDDEDYELFADDDFVPYVCHSCTGKNNNIKPIKTKLYDNIVISTHQNRKIKFVSKELNINSNDLAICSKCGGVYTKKMGIYDENKHNSSFICHFCNDLEQNPKYPSATDYYRKCLEEEKAYKESHPIEDYLEEE